jgi:hypothetical protein
MTTLVHMTRLVLLATAAFVFPAAVVHAQTLTITSGGTYSGLNLTNTNSSQSAISIQTTQAVKIQNCHVLTDGEGITNVSGANITVDSCYFEYNGTPGSKSGWKVLVDTWQPASLVVTHSNFNGPAGGVLVNWGAVSTTAYIAIAEDIFNDCYIAVQTNGIRNDPNVGIYFNQIGEGTAYAHGDHINIYDSCGTAAHPINIQQNLIACNPDAPLDVDAAGIQAGDWNSSYVKVYTNFVLNGPGCGLCIYYANGNTSTAVNNTVVGVGYPIGYSSGIGIQPNAGTASGNSAAWWDTYDQVMRSFDPPSLANGNYSLPKKDVSLSEEESLYLTWQQQMADSGVYVGNGTNPGITYPKASDFPAQ